MRTIIFLIALMLWCQSYCQTSKDIFCPEKFSLLENNNGKHSITLFPKYLSSFKQMNQLDTVFFKFEKDSSILFRVIKNISGFSIRENQFMENHEYIIDDSFNILYRSIKIGDKIIKDFSYNLLHLTESNEYDYNGDVLIHITFSNDQIKSVESTKKSKKKIYTSYFTDFTTIIIKEGKESLILTLRNDDLIYLEKSDGVITMQKTGKFESDCVINEINFLKLTTFESIRQIEGKTLINGIEIQN